MQISSLRFGYAAFVCLLACIAAPNVALLARDAFPDRGDWWFVLVLCAFSLALLHGIAGRSWRTGIALCAPLALLGILETAFAIEFGNTIDANALSLLPETNPAEAGDLLYGAWPWLVAAVAAVGLLATLAWRDPLRTRHPMRPRLIAVLVLAPAAMICIAHFAYRAPEPEPEMAAFSEDPQGQLLALRSAYPLGLPWVIRDFVTERRALRAAYLRNQAFRFGVKPLPPAPQRRIYVLVIGETTRGDRLGLNGYARDTTPRLKRRNGVIVFPRMFSLHTFSRLAVPVLVSRKPLASTQATFGEASIVTAFKEAGFSTTWISMQAPVGFHESPISVHAYEADRTLFLNPVDYRRHGKHDTAAIAVVRKLLQQDRRDAFVVIHTLGSHFNYADRYPASEAAYLPDRPRDRLLRLYALEDARMLSNAYDNTIRQIDKMLDGVIEVLDKQPNSSSWLLYSSDHGESLYDDCRQQAGHGQFSYYTHSVAALFWSSKTYKAGHPDKIARLLLNRNKPLSTDMAFDTLADLGELRLPGFRQDHSIAGAAPYEPGFALRAEQDKREACPVFPVHIEPSR